MRGAVAITLILAGLVALSGTLIYRGFLRFNYPILSEFPIQGVDVSHHQGQINWAALKGRRVSFAYIKASEGATFKDSRFQANWHGAKLAGVVPGAYHFFTLCRSGAEQAANFLSVLATVRGPHLPPAVDLEFGGNCGTRPTVDRFHEELSEFLVAVESTIGCRSILYVTQEFYESYVAMLSAAHHVWVRNIYRRPKLPGASWLLWQFANRGRMPGVTTYIDLNVFHGGNMEFTKFRCGAAQQAVQGDGPASGGPAP
jgi:lysozyme